MNENEEREALRREFEYRIRTAWALAHAHEKGGITAARKKELIRDEIDGAMASLALAGVEVAARRAPAEDAEPVAYEVQVTGEPGVVARVTYTPTEEQRATATPLYHHPAAPIEVTEEIVEAGARAILPGSAWWSDASAITGDPRWPSEQASAQEKARREARAVLAAAFKEMNR